MSALCTLDDAAVQINAAHALAQKHADQAIEHARRVGHMLLAVKQSLPHGEFLTWLDANVTVSARHAQRYMRAAQGKPLPVRKIAGLLKSAATTTKSDTVSFLTEPEIAEATFPRFRAGELLRASAVTVIVPGESAIYEELMLISAADENEVFIVRAVLGAEGGEVVHVVTFHFLRSSVHLDRLFSTPLVFAFPWDRSEIIERRSCNQDDRELFYELVSNNTGTSQAVDLRQFAEVQP